MPQFTYPIPDVREMITRPTELAVIRQIAAITGTKEDTFIEFGGMNEGIPTWKSLLGQENAPTGRFASFDKIQVTAEERIDEDYYLSTAYLYPSDAKTIWYDGDIGISLRPIYEKVKTTLSFRYRTVDLSTARNWITGMKRRILMNWLDQSLQSKYKVAIGPTVTEFLHEFHRMSQNVAPDGSSFEDWLDKRFLQKHTTLTTLDGRFPQVVLEETQLDVVGWFTFGELPKPQRAQQESAYEIEFTYEFQYERPTEMALKYPLMIHNQLVNKKYRPDYVVYDPVNLHGYATRSVSAYTQLLRNIGQFDRFARAGRILPYYDDWWPLPEHIVPSTTNVVQQLIGVDPNDPTLIIDFRNPGTFTLSDTMLAYMTRTRADLIKRTRSAVNIALYENDSLYEPSELYVDDSLCLRSRNPLDVKKLYHMRLTLFNDLFYLTKEAELIIRENPDYVTMILVGLDGRMATNGFLPKPNSGGFITRADWTRAVEWLRTTSDNFKTDYRQVGHTLLNFLVTVK